MDWKKLLNRGLAFLKSLKATTVIIAVLVGIVLMQRACPVVRYVDNDRIIYKDTTIFKYDTIKKTDYKDVFIYKTIVKHDTTFLFHDVDTTAILSDYFAEKFYVDTLSNDTILFALMRSKVAQNELQERSFTYSILRPETIIHKTEIINPLKNKIFVDLSIGINMNQISTPIGLSYMSKSDKVYSVKYDPFMKVFFIGTSFKLFEYGKH
jgi:hypothetical protein